MIPQIVHTRFELYACTIKLRKISEAYILLEHEDWLYATIADTEAEIRQLNTQLNKTPTPHTALKYAPKNVINNNLKYN